MFIHLYVRIIQPSSLTRSPCAITVWGIVQMHMISANIDSLHVLLEPTLICSLYACAVRYETAQYGTVRYGKVQYGLYCVHSVHKRN